MPYFIGTLSNIFVPIFTNVTDMTYPRLNILRLWLLIPGRFFIIIRFTTETGCATAWTLYPPLSSKTGHPAHRIDILIFIVHVLGCSRIISRINFIRTVMMYKISELRDIRVFIWAILTSSILLVLSLPVLGGGVTLLLFERNFNRSYFDINSADVILFQHLFWFFAHPEVYVLILPGFGIISLRVTYICGLEDVFRKTTIVYCILRITLLGCVVYGHHQYTVGLDLDTRQYFRTSTIIIRIPTGIKVLRWIIAIFSRCNYIQPTLYWVVGFICLFTMAGVTAIILSNTSIDIVLHDTYFTTSHFHQVLRLASVFGIFCSLSLFYPVLSGVIYSNLWINSSFWLIFIGVNLTFIPQYILGLNALPRKFPESSEYYRFLNFLRTRGRNFRVIALFIFLYTLVEGVITIRVFKINNSQKQEETRGLNSATIIKHSNIEILTTTIVYNTHFYFFYPFLNNNFFQLFYFITNRRAINYICFQKLQTLILINIFYILICFFRLYIKIRNKNYSFDIPTNISYFPNIFFKTKPPLILSLLRIFFNSYSYYCLWLRKSIRTNRGWIYYVYFHFSRNSTIFI